MSLAVAVAVALAIAVTGGGAVAVAGAQWPLLLLLLVLLLLLLLWVLFFATAPDESSTQEALFSEVPPHNQSCARKNSKMLHVSVTLSVERRLPASTRGLISPRTAHRTGTAVRGMQGPFASPCTAHRAGTT